MANINDAEAIQVIKGDPSKDPQVAQQVNRAIALQKRAKQARSRAGSGGNAQAEFDKASQYDVQGTSYNVEIASSPTTLAQELSKAKEEPLSQSLYRPDLQSRPDQFQNVSTQQNRVATNQISIPIQQTQQAMSQQSQVPDFARQQSVFASNKLPGSISEAAAPNKNVFFQLSDTLTEQGNVGFSVVTNKQGEVIDPFAIPRGSALILGQVSEGIGNVLQGVDQTLIQLRTPQGAATAIGSTLLFLPTLLQEKELQKELFQKIQDKPFTVATELGIGAVSEVGLLKAAKGIRSGVIEGTTVPINPKNVFATEVLEGKSKFPTTTSTDLTKQRVYDTQTSEGTFLLQTSSPAKLEGNVIGAGRKGAVGLEDPGAFTTSISRGSPAFLRIAPETEQLKVGIVPDLSSPSDSLASFIPGVSVSRELFKKVPSVTVFEVEKFVDVPKEKLLQPGFSGVKEFQQQPNIFSQAAVTKRSALGQGELPVQKFPSQIDFEVPFEGGLTVERNGQILKNEMQIKVGDIIREAKTSEEEIIVFTGTRFEYQKKGLLGFDASTTYQGEPVALRFAKTSRAIPDVEVDTSGNILNINQIKQALNEKKNIKNTFEYDSSTIDRPVTSQVSLIKQFSKVSLGKDSFTSPLSTKRGSSIVNSDINSSINSNIITSNSSNFSIGDSSVGFSSGGRSGGGSNGGGSSGGTSGGGSSGGGSIGVSSVGFSLGGSTSGGSSGGGISISSIITESPESKRRRKEISSPLKRGGFIAEVRRRGQFKPVNISLLSEQQAFLAGLGAVRGGAARSFRLRQVGEAERQNLFNTQDLYRSNKEQGVFIQTAKTSISSQGEKREITAKGIAASRLKRFNVRFSV